MNDREKCRDCGHTWGVTGAPRIDVLCSPCARPAPDRRPVHYWHLRHWASHPDMRYRSTEWWDQQTRIADLRYAAVFAAQQWPEEP